jgi:hypothetical protein
LRLWSASASDSEVTSPFSSIDTKRLSRALLPFSLAWQLQFSRVRVCVAGQLFSLAKKLER